MIYCLYFTILWHFAVIPAMNAATPPIKGGDVGSVELN